MSAISPPFTKSFTLPGTGVLSLNACSSFLWFTWASRRRFEHCTLPSPSFTRITSTSMTSPGNTSVVMSALGLSVSSFFSMMPSDL
jgi:hypothetical protein